MIVSGVVGDHRPLLRPRQGHNFLAAQNSQGNVGNQGKDEPKNFENGQVIKVSHSQLVFVEVK